MQEVNNKQVCKEIKSFQAVIGAKGGNKQEYW